MSAVSRSYEKIRHKIEAIVPTGTLKGKVFRGGAWLGLGSFSEQAIRFARNMLLTRILAPEAFGRGEARGPDGQGVVIAAAAGEDGAGVLLLVHTSGGADHE